MIWYQLQVVFFFLFNVIMNQQPSLLKILWFSELLGTGAEPTHGRRVWLVGDAQNSCWLIWLFGRFLLGNCGKMLSITVYVFISWTRNLGYRPSSSSSFRDPTDSTDHCGLFVLMCHHVALLQGSSAVRRGVVRGLGRDSDSIPMYDFKMVKIW